MKKLMLLCSIAMCCLSAYAGNSPSPVILNSTPSWLVILLPSTFNWEGGFSHARQTANQKVARHENVKANFCSGQITSTSVTPYPVTPGPHTLTVTTSGGPQNLVFFNTTQGASISNYSFNATTGVGTCNFYATGYGFVRIGITLTDSCGNQTTTYVTY